MFQRFTDRARRVVVLAQDEARGLNHNWIGTEHLLLGLIREGELGYISEGKDVGVKVFEPLEVSPEAVRRQVKEIIGHGLQAPPVGSVFMSGISTRITLVLADPRLA